MKDMSTMIANALRTKNVNPLNTSHAIESTDRKARYDVAQKLQEAERLLLYWQNAKKAIVLSGKFTDKQYNEIEFWLNVARRSVEAIKKLR